MITAATLVAARHQTSVRTRVSDDARVVTAPRSNLVLVELPRLDDLEPVVRAQVLDAAEALRRQLSDPQASSARWAGAYGDLGRVLHAYEFTDPAAASYENAARLAPADGRWSYLLGTLLQQTGQWLDAERWLVRARRDDPRNQAADVRLGDVYLQLNRLRDARVSFEAVADVFPALSQQGQGEVALREGRFVDAVRHLRAALARVPAATSLHYSLAMAYRGQARLDEARAALAKRGTGAIRLGDPLVDGVQALVRSERGLIALGRRAFEAGHFEAAAQAFARAADTVAPSAVAFANLGLARLRMGDEEAAKSAFERALSIDPKEPVAHAGLGALLAGQGRDAEAVPHLQVAVEQNPGDVSANRQFVGALVRLRRVDDAVEALGRARAAGVHDEDASLGLALLLAERERFADAVRVLDEAVSAFPESAAMSTTLARILAAAPTVAVRDGARALVLATATYERDPAAVHAETVAMALAELARCEEARGWLDKGIVHAETARDATEATRLKATVAAYAGEACRPPGR